MTQRVCAISPCGCRLAPLRSLAKCSHLHKIPRSSEPAPCRLHHIPRLRPAARFRHSAPRCQRPVFRCGRHFFRCQPSVVRCEVSIFRQQRSVFRCWRSIFRQQHPVFRCSHPVIRCQRPVIRCQNPDFRCQTPPKPCGFSMDAVTCAAGHSPQATVATEGRPLGIALLLQIFCKKAKLARLRVSGQPASPNPAH